jgi:CRP-like cAMP-binding protein
VKTRMDDTIRRLGELRLLSGCTRRELHDAAGLGTFVSIEEGVALSVEGRLGREAHLIAGGAAEVMVRGQPLYTMGQSECTGDIGLLDGGMSAETIVALTPMRTYVLTPQEFHSLLWISPTIAPRLAVDLARRLRSVEAHTLHAGLSGVSRPEIENVET